MRPILRHWALAAAIALVPATASATGNLGCEIDDANLKFNFEALFGYAVVTPLLQPRASFQSSNPAIQKTFRNFEMDDTALKQHWFEGNDVKLLFHVETDGHSVPYASVKLTIEATRVESDDIGYAGRYTLVIQPEVKAGSEVEAVTLTGAVACSAG